MKISAIRTLAYAVAALAAVTLGSCDDKKFRVDGSITDAKDSVLYFENMSLDGPVVIDSVKLGGDGEFSFSEKSPEAPEFYRLRIAGQIINLSVDSTENITVKAAYPTMATGYTVEGSAECATIKELALKQIALLQRVIAVERAANISFDQTRDSIARLVEAYKHDIKLNYIFKAPMRPSSYFALFQTLGNRLIFNPRENEDDIKAFAAVATSWDVYHPKSLRGENLHNIAIQGMRNVRIMRNQQAAQAIDASKVKQANLIDISLTDNQGRARSLTSLAGKVVLLDFHVFSSDGSTVERCVMRELYNKYPRARAGNLPGEPRPRRTLLENHNGRAAVDKRARPAGAAVAEPRAVQRQLAAHVLPHRQDQHPAQARRANKGLERRNRGVAQRVNSRNNTKGRGKETMPGWEKHRHEALLPAPSLFSYARHYGRLPLFAMRPAFPAQQIFFPF